LVRYDVVKTVLGAKILRNLSDQESASYSLRPYRNTAACADTSACDDEDFVGFGKTISDVLQLSVVLCADFLKRHAEVSEIKNFEMKVP
jgi:hypothetical protein